MKYQFVTDLNSHFVRDPENKDPDVFYAKTLGQDGQLHEEMTFVCPAVGDRKQYLMTDSIMYPVKGDETTLFHHEHRNGYETFFVDSGGMTLFIDGKKARVEPGMLIFMQPYETHAMIFDAPTKYRGFFHDWDALDNIDELMLLEAHMPGARKTPEFMEATMGKSDNNLRLPPVYKDVPTEQCPPIRDPKRPMAQYDLDGVTMKMITGRWENAGLCEMWLAEMKKGFAAEWVPFPDETEIYYVRKGKVKWTIYNDEYIANSESVVRIPKFAPHSLVALEDSDVYDVGGTTRWLALLQDIDSLKTYYPERAQDPQEIEKLKKDYNCRIKSISYTK